VLIAPFLLLLAMIRLLPPWEDEHGHDKAVV
jgi:hypothetical protein